MRRTKKGISAASAVLITAAGVLTVWAKEPEPAQGEKNGKLAIIHTNDTHGHDIAKEPTEDSAGTLGYAKIAQLKMDLEARGYDVLLVDAGDASQGTTLVNLSRGANAIEFMNAAGYDAMAPGNHEFDWGADAFAANTLAAEFPVLAANIMEDETGEPVFEGHTVYTTQSGRQIGLFGLAAPETAVRSNPKNVEGLTFLSGEELYTCAQEQIDALEKEGCELIVCIGHLGIDEESGPNRSTDVIENTEGIDIFIDGHSHSGIGEAIGKTLLASAGEYFESAGIVIWEPEDLPEATEEKNTSDNDTEVSSAVLLAENAELPEKNRPFVWAGEKGTFLSYTVTAAECETEDQNVAALVLEKESLIKEELSAVVAVCETELNGEQEPGVRTGETNLGDLAADAMLWQAEQVFGPGIDCAFNNSSGIRASVAAGDISKNDLLNVFPSENYITVLTVTGEQLLTVLEAACFAAPKASGVFPQVSGLVFTVDTSVPYENGEAYGDSTYYAPAEPGARVTIESVGGKAFDPEKEYVIAVNDYMSSGGDAYRGLAEAYNENGSSTGVLLSDALIAFVTEELDGMVGGVYTKPQGRITVLQQ